MAETYGPSLEDLLALALDVAEEAGRVLLEERPADRSSLDVETKSSPTDVVTVMDRRAEELLVARLREARPGDGFLGEEGADEPGDSGVRWVLDPVDGTVNYLYALPGWAVSVAAEVDGEVMVGVVEIPTYGETFAAVLGAGATRNGEPVQASTADRLDQALVATGFSYDASVRGRQAEVVAHALPRVRDIRRYGSAAVDLCAVGCGRVDGYFERGLKPWDLAAGGLVAREGGAVVQGLHGRAASEALVVAAGPALFPLLHDLIAPFRPDEG